MTMVNHLNEKELQSEKMSYRSIRAIYSKFIRLCWSGRDKN